MGGTNPQVSELLIVRVSRQPDVVEREEELTEAKNKRS